MATVATEMATENLSGGCVPLVPQARVAAIAALHAQERTDMATTQDERVWKHWAKHEKLKGANYKATCLVCQRTFASVGPTKARCHLAGVTGCGVDKINLHKINLEKKKAAKFVAGDEDLEAGEAESDEDVEEES